MVKVRRNNNKMFLIPTAVIQFLGICASRIDNCASLCFRESLVKRRKGFFEEVS